MRSVYDDLANNTGPISLEERARIFLNIEQATSLRRLIEMDFGKKCKIYGYMIPDECIKQSVLEFLEKKEWEFDAERLRSIYKT